MELKEGRYELPPDLKAKIVEGRVVVVSKRTGHDYGAKRCKHCKHCKFGKKAMATQWWDSHYCDQKPKSIGGYDGYFYATQPSRKACEMFEDKNQ